jgi:hypothetical protein
MNVDFPFEPDTGAFWAVISAMAAMLVGMVVSSGAAAGCGSAWRKLGVLSPVVLRGTVSNSRGRTQAEHKALLRREDIDGLERAAAYQDLKPTPQGTASDLGIPVRAEAILALGCLDTAGDTKVLAQVFATPPTSSDAPPCAPCTRVGRPVSSCGR